jgi:heterodisulfide reductase subunit D
MAQYTDGEANRSENRSDPGAGQDPGSETKRFYEDLVECYRLQVLREEVEWEMTATERAGEAQVVLNLSCGIQGTPHLMRLHVAVFKALGIDFVATAGTKFCCGRGFGDPDDPGKSDRVAVRSIARLATWKSKVSVQCCGSCFVQFHENVARLRERTGDAPHEVVHITEFLRDTLRQLGDSVPWTRREPRVRRVLLHAEGEEVHPSKVAQRNAVIQTLEMMPGVEYAGLVEAPTLGSPCGSDQRADSAGSVGHTMLSDITTAEYRATQRELLDQARAAGADAILTHHHKCHREWSKFSSPQLPVMHYQTLLGDRLGIEVPEDRFQRLWQLDDTEQILAQTRPYWESWGITESTARAMVPKFFVPQYEASIQRCPCETDGGGCFTATLHGTPDLDAMCRQLRI